MTSEWFKQLTKQYNHILQKGTIKQLDKANNVILESIDKIKKIIKGAEE